MTDREDLEISSEMEEVARQQQGLIAHLKSHFHNRFVENVDVRYPDDGSVVMTVTLVKPSAELQKAMDVLA